LRKCKRADQEKSGSQHCRPKAFFHNLLLDFDSGSWDQGKKKMGDKSQKSGFHETDNSQYLAALRGLSSREDFKEKSKILL